MLKLPRRLSDHCRTLFKGLELLTEEFCEIGQGEAFMNKQKAVDETELFRQMLDQAARAEVPALWQRRNASLQRLLARVQTLSDAEFEAAYQTLESLIENFAHKKIKTEKKKPANNEELQNTLNKKPAA